MPNQPDTVFDRILRAMRPVDATAPYGGWAMNVTGGGSGGTSMIDGNPFTPGATSFTPAGGYFGGRSIASGNAAVLAMSGSAILQVDVVAGGAGGGAAQNQVQGTAGNWVNVGFASGAAGAAGNWAIPVVQASGAIFTVNIGAGGGGFASAAVYGSPANPVYVVGTTGVQQLGAPWSMVGSAGVTPLSTFTVALDKIPTVNLGLGTVNIGNAVGVFGSFTGIQTVNLGSIPTVNLGLGTVNVGNAVGVFGSMTGIQTVNLASHIDTANSAVRVNVVTGGAGGGNADLQVRGTGNAAFHVGYASNNLGAWPNYDGGAWMPVMFPSGFYPTVNIAGGGAGGGFASVAVYGSPANPVYVVGSQTIVNTVTVNLATALDKTNDSVAIGVSGSGNTAYRIGYASNNLGAWPNYDGGAWMPVMYPSGYYPTVNIAGGGAGGGFASVAVYGSPANPVYFIGSVNAVGGGGSMGVVNLGGSVGVFPQATFTVALDKVATVNVGNIAGVNASIQGVPSVWVTNVVPIDTSASLSPTQWPFSFGGSGYLAISVASANPAVRTKIYTIHVSAAATVRQNISFQSPSGTFLTGSIPVPPGAGFNMSGVIKSPILIGGSNATLFIHANGTENIAGWLTGYIEAG